jgi:2-dehydro-3-deoxyphosphogluconate aldolase/(4S)-4-hydroxy-2-oxoglutarate aldolase
MTTNDRDTTLDEIGRRGIVAVIRAGSADRAVEAAVALAQGGITAVEVSFTTPDAADAISRLSVDPRLLVGAGTVMDHEQARAAVAAGARYLISPHPCEAALEVGDEAGVLVVPGVFTPAEIVAWSPRTPLLKLFPASLGGPGLLRTLRGPFPSQAFMPSGGVLASNVGEWLAAGASVVAAGGDLCPRAAVDAGDHEELARRARAYRQALDEVRGEVAL